MEYILDTADIEAIRHCNEFYPIDGVTTNPSIISKENCDWFLIWEILCWTDTIPFLHINYSKSTSNISTLKMRCM